MKKSTSPNAGDHVGQQELACIADGDATWHSQFGRQLGGLFFFNFPLIFYYFIFH